MSRTASGLLTLAMLASGHAGLGGCADNEDEKYSDHYALSELSGSYGSFADESSLSIFVAFLGPKGFTRLRGGDTVEVTVNGARAATRERVLEDKVHYIVEMPPPATETEIAIAFVRGVERVERRMKLYAAFDVPSPPSSVKRGQSVTFDIDPRPDLSKWPGFFGPSLVAKAELLGTCLETGSQQVELCAADSPAGQCKQGYPLRLDTSKLIPIPGSNGCEVTMQLRLTSSPTELQGLGPTKQVLKGGGWDGHRLKNVKLQLTE